MLLPSLLSEISSHDLEVAETLIGILRFVLIFVGARTLSEILVRLEPVSYTHLRAHET